MTRKKFLFQIVKLTNEYYHLIPIYGFENETIQPISEKKMLREHTKLLANLMDLQVASNILLGANLRQAGNGNNQLQHGTYFAVVILINSSLCLDNPIVKVLTLFYLRNQSFGLHLWQP